MLLILFYVSPGTIVCMCYAKSFSCSLHIGPRLHLITAICQVTCLRIFNDHRSAFKAHCAGRPCHIWTSIKDYILYDSVWLHHQWSSSLLIMNNNFILLASAWSDHCQTGRINKTTSSGPVWQHEVDKIKNPTTLSILTKFRCIYLCSFVILWLLI